MIKDLTNVKFAKKVAEEVNKRSAFRISENDYLAWVTDDYNRGNVQLFNLAVSEILKEDGYKEYEIVGRLPFKLIFELGLLNELDPDVFTIYTGEYTAVGGVILGETK